MIEATKLPFEPTSLTPHISKDTVNVHYEKHYKGYVNNLNKLIKGTVYEDLDLEEIVMQSSGTTYNNAAQAWNHEFYFYGLTAEDTSPSEELEKAINDKWGSVDNFKKDFNKVSKTLFGSGWTWLVWDTYEDSLNVYNLPNADNPLTAKLYVFRENEKYIPLMCYDLWEHNYYLQYKNDKSAALTAFWEVINWDFVNSNFENINA